jgi:hypothetical protein
MIWMERGSSVQDLQGMVSVLSQFALKWQAALSSRLNGAVLVAVGYDAELYKDAAAIPALWGC